MNQPVRDAASALDGVRILDFTRLGFGSQATLILGCLGAEVVRVESTRHPDPIRGMPPYVPTGEDDSGQGFGNVSLANVRERPSLNRGGIFFKYNTGGKRSITVDARQPEGLELLRRLVGVSDVVAESFAAGTLERWGLGYEVLRSIREDIVYVSMSGYGHAGPERDFVTMGPTAQALTGHTYAVGLADRHPCGWSYSHLDHVGGYLGAVATLMALIHRQRTGEGQYVDVSQLEPATALLGRFLLDAAVNGRATRTAERFPPGNRRWYDTGAPQGLYPCEGRDRWVAISCTTQDHWRALRAATGEPAWAADERFVDLASRREHADALDEYLATWTRERDRYTAMHELQAHGVPAGAVQDAADKVERDEQLAARGHFTELPTAETPPVRLEGVPFSMSTTPPATGGRLHRGPPAIGEDTDDVLRGLLELSDDELARLRDRGVLA